MKLNLKLLLASASLAGALLGGLALANAQNSATPPPSGVPGEPRHGAHERHPAIHRAIAALEAAKRDLQQADHDFGGHRVEALEQVDKAIAQLRLALQYDKK